MNRHTLTKRVKFLARPLLISMALLGVRCSFNPVSGTGSQAGNARIACTVYNDDGTPASGATVILRSHDYTAETVSSLRKIKTSMVDARTDSHGVFYIGSVDTGNYCIEVNDRNSHARLLTCTIKNNDTLIRFSKVTLQPTGSIKLNIGSKPESSVDLYLQIYGLERIGRYDSLTGECIISDVPCGNYTLKVLASSDDYRPVELENIVLDTNGSVDAGTIDFLHQSQWQYSRKLYLNTTPDGADVAEMVTEFPLLVRLNKDNFNFDQVNKNGSDIRFTKNAQSLPYHIELWDVTNRAALIWVKLDTVYGNDNSRFITMYWGNSQAIDSSSSASVFDTASGYQGVWHLDENGNTMVDATVNKRDGIRNGNQKRTAGIIGSAQFFDGTGDYTDAGNVCNPDTAGFTISAWIRKNGTGKIETIVSKSAGGMANPAYGWLLQLDADGAFALYIATAEVSNGWNDSGSFVLTSNVWITDSAWHQVAAVINRSNSDDCHVFIDGSDVSTYPTGGDIKNIGSVKNTLPLRFGADGKGNFAWNGYLDDISIAYRVRSTGYIKLLYENQKSESRLIEFK